MWEVNLKAEEIKREWGREQQAVEDPAKDGVLKKDLDHNNKDGWRMAKGGDS